MNNQETEVLDYTPGRAPADVVWERIERHLNKQPKSKRTIAEWWYAMDVLSLITVMGIVVMYFVV
jgi:hypothetical protein